MEHPAKFAGEEARAEKWLNASMSDREAPPNAHNLATTSFHNNLLSSDSLNIYLISTVSQRIITPSHPELSFGVPINISRWHASDSHHFRQLTPMEDDLKRCRRIKWLMFQQDLFFTSRLGGKPRRATLQGCEVKGNIYVVADIGENFVLADTCGHGGTYLALGVYE